jgi:hypothetical protein
VRQALGGIVLSTLSALPSVDYFLNVNRAITTFALPFALARVGLPAVSNDELDTHLQGDPILGGMRQGVSPICQSWRKALVAFFA